MNYLPNATRQLPITSQLRVIFRLAVGLWLLALYLGPAVQAQADSLTSLQIGLGFGQTFSSVDFSLSSRRANPSQPLIGQNYGVAVRYFNTKVAGFVAELNINQGGWSETLTQTVAGSTVSGAYERSVTYGELQLLSQFAFGRRFFRPFAQAGPYFGLPISDRESLAAGLVLPEEDTYFGQALPRRFNYGLSAGAGFYLQIAKIGMQAAGHYQAAFRDSFRPGDSNISTSRRQAFGWRLTLWYGL